MVEYKKVKVFLKRCKDYNREDVFRAVDGIFDELGGLARFVNKGERVLIKPNLLSARPPEDGVDVHPEIVRAVALIVRRYGAVPIVGDSPGGFAVKSTDEVYERSGLGRMCAEEGIELVKFDKAITVSNPGPSVEFGIDNIPIAKVAKDVDKIISISKMKTHSLLVLTGAVKNMFGAVVGLYKAHCHKMAPSPKNFSKVIVDVFSLVRPVLNIMDGVLAMEGNGPANGSLRHMGVILASEDAVALDSVFSRLVGLGAFSLYTTKEAFQRGIGEARPECIKIIGDFKEVSVRFKLPPIGLTSVLPPFLSRFLAKFLEFYPYIDQKVCKHCRLCAESCPASTILVDEKVARINWDECLRCMCCLEVCPHRAILVRRSLLMRLLGYGESV